MRGNKKGPTGLMGVADFITSLKRASFQHQLAKVQQLYGKKEPTMNYKLASELYKALDEKRTIQFKNPVTKKWTDWTSTYAGVQPDFWNARFEWQIKPEPREFTLGIPKSNNILGEIGVITNKSHGNNIAFFDYIKVREVLED